MVYPCNKLILSNTKELTIDTHNLKQTQEHCIKEKKPGTKDYILHDYTYKKYLEEAELYGEPKSRLVFARTGGGNRDEWA